MLCLLLFLFKKFELELYQLRYLEGYKDWSYFVCSFFYFFCKTELLFSFKSNFCYNLFCCRSWYCCCLSEGLFDFVNSAVFPQGTRSVAVDYHRILLLFSYVFMGTTSVHRSVYMFVWLAGWIQVVSDV